MPPKRKTATKTTDKLGVCPLLMASPDERIIDTRCIGVCCSWFVDSNFNCAIKVIAMKWNEMMNWATKEEK